MSFLVDLQSYQRGFSEQLGTLMHQIQAGDAQLASLSLIGLGFAYGFLHAIGPGHGKLIITGYLMAKGSSLRRGLLLAVAASFLQALTAITLVLLAFYALGLARAQAQQAAAWLELGSFALIGLLGLALVWRGLRGVWRAYTPHTHHHDGSCCHAHPPEAATVAQASLRELLLMALAIGIRPCSGALILLFFACLLQLVWAGILATFAMAAGTALAICSFALLAVKSRQLALRISARSERASAIGEALLTLLAGLLVVAAASLFLLSALPGESEATPAPTHPLMRKP